MNNAETGKEIFMEDVLDAVGDCMDAVDKILGFEFSALKESDILHERIMTAIDDVTNCSGYRNYN